MRGITIQSLTSPGTSKQQIARYFKKKLLSPHPRAAVKMPCAPHTISPPTLTPLNFPLLPITDSHLCDKLSYRWCPFRHVLSRFFVIRSEETDHFFVCALVDHCFVLWLLIQPTTRSLEKVIWRCRCLLLRLTRHGRSSLTRSLTILSSCEERRDPTQGLWWLLWRTFGV